MRRSLTCLSLLLCCGVAHAQERMAGNGQYPQARSISGLSGGGSAVQPDGTPSLRGALALSTPIGYTLGGGRLVIIGGTTSTTLSPKWFDGAVAQNGSNGSAALVFGADVFDANVAVSFVQTSRLSKDRVVHLQVSPRRSLGRLGVSLGVQDLFDETVTTPDYGEPTQSLFAAATYDVGEGVFVSTGLGTRRFGHGFASVSAPLSPDSRAMVEHDGYGWNYGLEVDLLGLEEGEAALFLGLCQNRYATWALSVRF